MNVQAFQSKEKEFQIWLIDSIHKTGIAENAPQHNIICCHEGRVIDVISKGIDFVELTNDISC